MGEFYLDNSISLELPIWIFKIGFKIGIGGIVNLKETHFEDINFYYAIAFVIRTSAN